MPPTPATPHTPEVLLAIESSCDDTAAAVLVRGAVASSVVHSQLTHADFGGVLPEMASRLHLTAIGPVVRAALEQASCSLAQVQAVAVTAGPGLLGSLHVGVAYAKGLALALGCPLLGVDHLQGHLASAYLSEPPPAPGPLLTLIVSGGHTQLVQQASPLEAHVLGHTRDDAVGEAFDKVAKLLGLPYPGGAALDALAEGGDAQHHRFATPRVEALDFSFSGLKTAFLYHLRDASARQPDYAQRHSADLAAAIRHTLVEALVSKFALAAQGTGIRQWAVVGGVSANRLLRRRMAELAQTHGASLHLPPLRYCTDNAAMIGLAAHHLLAAGRTGPTAKPDPLALVPFASGE